MFKKIFIAVIFSLYFVEASNEFSRALNQIRTLEKQGQYTDVDSLYSKLDETQKLSSHDLMKWASTKYIIGKEHEAGSLYCRADKGRLSSLIRNSFLRNLENSTDTINSSKALNAYFNCSLSKEDSLKSSANWAIRTASRLQLYQLETSFIKHLYGNKNRMLGSALLSSAKKRLVKGDHNDAIRAAKKAWPILTSQNLKNNCSEIIFQSYMIKGEKDSAFIWMKNTNLNRVSLITKAIILCQETNNLQITDTLIAQLPAGIHKDTLIIRNLVFKDQATKALAYVKKIHGRYNNAYQNVITFWSSQLYLFSGQIENFKKEVNSESVKKIPFNSNLKTHFLKWQTTLSIIGNNSNALKTFGLISSYSFTGDFKPINLYIKKFDNEPKIKELLLSEYLRGIIDTEKYSAGTTILNEITSNSENEELLYLKGVILIKTDLIKEGTGILENLVLKGKGSLYSQKARIYLLKNNSTL